MSIPLVVRQADEIAPVECPCGLSRRIITGADNPHVSVHRTEFHQAQRHLHKETTEIYYVIEGSGILSLDNKEIELTPGTTVQIPPGTSHKVIGKVTALIIAQPAFDPDDEIIIGPVRGDVGND